MHNLFPFYRYLHLIFLFYQLIKFEDHGYVLQILSTDRIKRLNEDIDKMEKDYAYLLNPGLLPNA
jgi:hypothetical protein